MYEAWTGVQPWGDIIDDSMSRDSIVLIITRQKKPPKMAKEKWDEMSSDFQEFYQRILEMVGMMISGLNI